MAAIRSNLEALLADLQKAKPASAKRLHKKNSSIVNFGAGTTDDQASLTL